MLNLILGICIGIIIMFIVDLVVGCIAINENLDKQNKTLNLRIKNMESCFEYDKMYTNNLLEGEIVDIKDRLRLIKGMLENEASE